MESEYNTVIIKNGNHGWFYIYVDGGLMWFCENWEDVEIQLKRAEEYGLIRESTTVKNMVQ